VHNPQPIRVLLQTQTQRAVVILCSVNLAVTLRGRIFEVLENSVLKYTPEFKRESVAGQKNGKYVITLLMPFACP